MNRVSARAMPDRELSVSEMLSDPIVQKVMDHDGVTRLEVEGLVRAAQKELTGQCLKDGQSDSDREEKTRQRNGDDMSKNSRHCVECACSADFSVAAAAGMPGVNHNHARLPGVLRYRGMENEAVMAARLVKVESLIWNLQSVLHDLDTAMGAPVTSGVCVEAAADIGGHAAPEQDAQPFSRRQARFLERMFESALSSLRTGNGDSGEQTEPGTERHFNSPARDMNGGPDWGSACAEGR